MSGSPNADQFHRTALLAMHDGSQPTLEAALAAHAATGVLISTDAATCQDVSGQAALLTAVVTATRAFGNVLVHASDPEVVIMSGVYAGRTLRAAVAHQGAHLVQLPLDSDIGRSWPVLLIGSSTSAPPVPTPGTVLRATWTGWTAEVRASDSAPPCAVGARCVLAAIAAAAMGVSEVFGNTRNSPGSDAGFRDISLNLWHPGAPDRDGPALAHAPASWWLVGLGHLGQAYSWVISWLTYNDPSAIEVVLQDVDHTTPGNHSTGVLTPPGSNGQRKTRLISDVLGNTGIDTRIIERRLSSDLRVTDDECHVAMIGVDNLHARRLISDVGWLLAVDVGLGSGPQNFASILLHRFPGTRRSDEVPAWRNTSDRPITVPATPAFTDLQARQDACGVIELAGKAVGASFVGVAAACLAVAEATRELHGGVGFDIVTLDLVTLDKTTAPATVPADLISLPLSMPPPMVG